MIQTKNIMKKIPYYFIRYIAFFSLVALVTACDLALTSQPSPNLIISTQTETGKAISAITLTPTPYNSAPEDPELDRNCRETINSFFSFRKGFGVQAYRNLFAQSAQHFADAALNPPLESRTILVLMPVSQWWQKNYPATPIPGAYLPEEPGEYIYYVKYTGHYELNETPAVIFPDSMTMTMVQEGSSKTCKIKNYGKG